MGSLAFMRVGGRAAVAEYAPRLIGLTLEEGKHLLAALQVHLVQVQAEDHCRRRRRCQRCGAKRPLKDQRSRRLVSLFGTVEIRAPRFAPCRCAVTCRRTLNPVAEIMPDRCTPEYERTLAKMGSLLPYRRARRLLAEFLPLGKPRAVETTRQRTLRVGTSLEQEAVAGFRTRPPRRSDRVPATPTIWHRAACRRDCRFGRASISWDAGGARSYHLTDALAGCLIFATMKPLLPSLMTTSTLSCSIGRI
jgi:hypothetical protein